MTSAYFLLDFSWKTRVDYNDWLCFVKPEDSKGIEFWRVTRHTHKEDVMSRHDCAQDEQDLQLVSMDDVVEAIEVPPSERNAANEPKNDQPPHKVRWQIEDIMDWRQRCDELGLPDDVAFQTD